MDESKVYQLEDKLRELRNTDTYWKDKYDEAIKEANRLRLEVLHLKKQLL